MKLLMKPLKGDPFTLEDVNTEIKVSQLKQLVEAQKPDFPADSLKLIYSGRIMADEQVLSEYNVKDGDFIVVMAAKAKPKPAAEPAPAPVPAATPAPAPAATRADAPAAQDTANANMVAGSAQEATIQQLCDMGFERQEVERCLRAAYNNPDRAVEYLMSGIPDGALDTPAVPGTGGAATAGGNPVGTAVPYPSTTGGGGGGPLPPALQNLRDSPAFPELAAMVQQNPQSLPQVLTAMQVTNPEAAAAIRENPETFLRMVAEANNSNTAASGRGAGVPPAGPVAGTGGNPLASMQSNPQLAQFIQMAQQNPQILQEIIPMIEREDPAAAQLIRENPQAFLQMLQQAGAGGGTGGPQGAPQQNVVRLTEEESAAVQRLTDLGFDRNMAAQAYFACDKNEEIAANYLFEHGGDD